MKKISSGQLIEIEWIDSHHPIYNDGWIKPKQVIEWFKETSPQLCKSVGYFLRYTKKEVILYQSRSGEEVLNLMAIPKGCIQKITIL